MTRTHKFLAFALMAGILTAGAMNAAAQTTGGSATGAGDRTVLNGPGIHSIPDNPVAQVRDAQSWEYGPFVNFGNGVGGDNRSQYKFLWAGVQLAKPLTPVLHAGVFTGQFEYGANIMPLWQAYTPAPHLANYTCVDKTGAKYTCPLKVGGGTFRGVSLTPVIFRWNFLTSSRRVQPWFQAAGGLIYTTHKFPPNFQSTQNVDGQTVLINGGTCVWNFSPQGGAGIHIFTRPKRSIDIGVNGVHISSASLGDRNPGVNASFQVQVGYTFWK